MWEALIARALGGSYSSLGWPRGGAVVVPVLGLRATRRHCAARCSGGCGWARGMGWGGCAVPRQRRCATVSRWPPPLPLLSPFPPAALPPPRPSRHRDRARAIHQGRPGSGFQAGRGPGTGARPAHKHRRHALHHLHRRVLYKVRCRGLCGTRWACSRGRCCACTLVCKYACGCARAAFVVPPSRRTRIQSLPPRLLGRSSSVCQRLCVASARRLGGYKPTCHAPALRAPPGHAAFPGVV
jgi:hypothetical protein